MWVIVDGVINLDSHDGLEDVDVEQGSYHLQPVDSGVSFTLGKYGSALGFEREDPTSYTHSHVHTKKTPVSTLEISIDEALHVVEGLTVAYSNDIFSLGASLKTPLAQTQRTTILISKLLLLIQVSKMLISVLDTSSTTKPTLN
jgi:hypothetical protein